MTSIDATGNESTGVTVNTTTLSDNVPPSTPTGLTAVGGNANVVLSWNANNESDLSSYNLYKSTDGLSFSIYLTALTGVTYTDNNVTNGNIYYYKLTAVDTTGNESSQTSSVSATPTAQQQANVAPSTPTNLFPFNGSAWTKLHFEADLIDSDSTNFTFYVDYSTNSTLSSGVITLSSPVTLPSSGTKSRGSITSATSVTESTVYYWRAYVKDDSGNQSSYSPIFTFTIKNATSDNMVADGTPFMQQGDPNIHGVIVDINSANDTSINFATMKSSGVKGAYLRCYGHDSAIDVNFVTWAGQAKSAGVLTGGYYYAMPKSPTLDLTDARTQAETFANGLQQGYGTGNYGDLLPMLDLEDNSGYAPAGQATTNMAVSDFLSWSNEFRNHFESITGRTLGVYTDNYFVRDKMNNFNCDLNTGQPLAGTQGNPLVDMPLWVAGFDYYPRYMGSVMPVMGGWNKWYAFQHTDKATASTYGVTTSGNNQIDQSWCEPVDYLKPPNAVAGLSSSQNGTTITLTWNTTTEVDVHQWDIYIDSTKVGSSNTDGSYVITNAQTGTHTIKVIPIDTFGDDPTTLPNTISYTINANPPSITIIDVTHYTLSDEAGFTSTDITFSFDEDITDWTVNVNGVSWDSGTIADSGSSGNVSSPPTTVLTASTWTVSIMATKTVSDLANGSNSNVITAGTQVKATIDWTELYQEGQNRVNIYGKNTGGQWTPYQS